VSKLTELQEDILKALAEADLGWVLTGGGALAGMYLAHRPTRDLDLFWHGRRQLDHLPREVEERLRAAGLEVCTVQSGLTFCRLNVSRAAETCVVDLVADPVAPVETPEEVELEGRRIAVDSPREILANKLAALLGRCELRDLADVKALLESGLDLVQGLRDAARKDAGFSALTLAWVLRDIDPRAAAQSLGWTPDDADEIAEFRRQLVDRLIELGGPE
jgi:predicted nucleotidyltransferase component of viral defense system